MTLAGRSWRELAAMPAPRSHLSAVTSSGALFAVGGLPRGGASSLGFDRYEPLTDTWTSLTALPVGTDHSAAAAVGSSIFVFGGTFEQPSTRAYRIDVPPAGAQSAQFAAMRWRPISPLLEPRSAAGAAVVGDRIYVVGGFDATRRELKTAYVYDTAGDTWRRIADLPTPREHLAVTDFRGQVCALGGHVGNAVATSTVECYDPATDHWSAGMPLPKPASDFAAAFFDGGIWTAGDDVQIFDGTRWWLGPSLGTPRFGVAAAVVSGSLYVIGGAARKPAPDGVVERFDAR
ncbi:MAG TPA: kelch repeat-containing protein [Candidatus Limnocylindria bacterium]|nr:kelch repeat-containing protein [Candidatus Limnocylindria bacterium]